ncbi:MULTISPECIES: hypothetical protein [Bacillus]|uniref:hypothetical protein n=1 Tax=Bacillus TaxID=1386 RepID=UPI0005341051|nr:hypothetical protein [Bacillus wiedmannii]MBJ8115260.1 hypothetical protein [Bacillus cereus]PFW85610.1 hypothetical protein COL27_07290 [Bacillus sp. AFS075960]RFB14482.1 hypothetical protein DZB88_11450 [Bacillus sp. OE]RFB26682.1 hypothetical protein DZB85_00310 [Bacillus sp. LB(2018)]RFB47594.1 hypothetical protein DZB83_10135 [Bacillus sp. dmp10]RFB74780.1 hypothetical protein DZB94_12325 [Bacillus sp. AW]HDR8172284.1 hypothetical protein [Bacillus thuringiensis]
MKVKNIYKERSKCTGPIFVMMEGIDVDITQSIARIVVNGKDLPFRSVSTSVWNQGPVNDLIVSTNQRVEEFYQFMWSQVPVMLAMYFLQGADLMRFARIIGINQSVAGEYIYHFSWG